MLQLHRSFDIPVQLDSLVFSPPSPELYYITFAEMNMLKTG